MIQKQLEKHYLQVAITGRGSNIVIELDKPRLTAFRGNELKQALIDNMIYKLRVDHQYKRERLNRPKTQWGRYMGLHFALSQSNIDQRANEIEDDQSKSVSRAFKQVAYRINTRQANTVDSVLSSVAKALDAKIVKLQAFLVEVEQPVNDPNDPDAEPIIHRDVFYGSAGRADDPGASVYDVMAKDLDRFVHDLKAKKGVKRLNQIVKTEEYQRFLDDLGTPYHQQVLRTWQSKKLTNISYGKLWRLAKTAKLTSNKDLRALFIDDCDQWLERYRSRKVELATNGNPEFWDIFYDKDLDEMIKEYNKNKENYFNVETEERNNDII
ncbi:hypothetical protein ABC389_10615 [Limosilactobacillus sp. WILCCON 0053]|uniref:hypothetical protein n=1 Tax=Limosilactobacillus allomucosae TaxID=3142938 RepID=UPI003264448D